MKLSKIHSSFLYLFVCLVFGVFYSVLYFNYLQKDPILGRDDVLLVYPLKSISTLNQYVTDVKNNTILDFQPIRDLTLYLNIKTIEWSGISTFHITNFVLFLFSIFLFMKLLDALEFLRNQIIWSGILFASHPLMVSSVGWISARKHSLGLVFLLLCLLSFIKHRKITIFSILCYAFSILSHQIFILFPAWLFLYARCKKIKLDKVRSLVLSFIGLVVLFLGVLKTFFLEMGNVTYKHFHWYENISRYVLSVGRSVSQVILPISISGDYYQGSILNLLGIPLLILCLFFIYKSKNRLDPFLWIGLAAVVHIPTYIAFTNDTYLYLPLICVIVSANYYFLNMSFQINSKIKFASLLFYISLLLTKTISASQMWRSDLDLWRYSYSNEPSPFNSILYGTHLLKYDEKVGLEFIIWGANNYDLIGNKAVFFSFLDIISRSSLPIQKKIEVFKDCYRDHEIYKAYYGRSLLEGTNEQMLLGINILKPLLKDEKSYPPGSQGTTIIQSIKQLCLDHKDKIQVCKDLGLSTYGQQEGIP